MTVENTTKQKRVNSDGVTDTISFSFPVIQTSDLKVYVINSSNVATLLTEGLDYDVTLNEDTEGGEIVLNSVEDNTHDYLLDRDLEMTQTADLPTEGNFNETSVERALDRLVMQNIQQQNQIDRSPKLQVNDVLNDDSFDGIFFDLEATADRMGRLVQWNAAGTGFEAGSLAVDLDAVGEALADVIAVSDHIDDVIIVADDLTGSDTIGTVAAAISQVVATGNAIASVITVAGISANVTTVAGISANVTTVAGIAAAVTTVAGIQAAVSNVSSISTAVSNVNTIRTDVSAVSAIAANVTTVAGIATDVTTVAGDRTKIIGVYDDLTKIDAVYGDLTAIDGVYAIRANVTTVAGISGNVTTVAGISGNVTTVAGISANVTTVAGISANVTTVAGISANIATLAAISTDITAAANNIPKANRTAVIPPTVNDDVSLSYSEGSLWIDTAANAGYLCLDPTDGAAIWQQITTAATSAAAITFSAAGLTYTDADDVQEAIADLDASIGGIVAGLSPKTSCRVATTAALTVLYAAGVMTNNGALAALQIDGVSLAVNDRVLVKDQASALQNGWYKVTTVGSGAVAWVMTRTTDADATGEIVEGNYSIIEEGTTNVGTLWIQTHTGTITIGTTAIDFTQLKITAVAASALTGTVLASNVVTSSLTSVGTIATGVWNGTKVSEVYGGTNQSTYTQGDILYASAANTLSKLGAGTAGQYLRTAGAAANPAWQDVGTYRTTAAATTLVAADHMGHIELTGSTNRTWDATAAATLGAKWSTYVVNNSTANLTFDPNASETIDGLTSIIMYPGEIRRISCDGSNFISHVIKGFKAVFTASGSFTKPPGYTKFEVEIWSGGGAGAVRTTTGNVSGGSGGAYYPFTVNSSALVAAGSTETVTVGGTAAAVASSNANGTAGNNSTFTVNGVNVTVVGGKGGLHVATSTLAGYQESGYPSSINLGSGNGPYWYTLAESVSAISTATVGTVLWAGVGGDCSSGNVPAAGGNSIMGGAGGGASSGTAGGTRTGGTSVMGGAGGTGSSTAGAGVTAGSVPGGGGGGGVGGSASGAGAAGQIIVRGIV